MTEISTLRKVIILCAAAGLCALMSGCDRHDDLQASLASLKDVRVDASEQPRGGAADKKLNKKDVDLLVSTAKDMTVGKGGLLDKSAAPAHKGLQIAVVDPLDMTRPDDGRKPLDERLGGPIDMSDAVRTAAHDLPDLPIAAVPASSTHTAIIATETATASTGRFIQIGSFSSAAAAQNAWADLIRKVPGADRYSPSYQKVTSANGKPLVRLRVGPVTTAGQAQSLCDKLGVRDSWCARAG